MRLWLLCSLVACLALGGCLHTSDSAQTSKMNEFNAAAVEKAAKDGGKQAQYDAAKKREEEFLKSNPDVEQQPEKGQ